MKNIFFLSFSLIVLSISFVGAVSVFNEKEVNTSVISRPKPTPGPIPYSLQD